MDGPGKLLEGGPGVTNYIDNTVHQIKSPLTVIKTYIQLIQAEMYGPLTKDLGTKISLISSNLEEISYFLEQIHDVTVLGRREEPPEKELLDLAKVVEMACSDMAEYAKSCGISIEAAGIEESTHLMFNEHWMRRTLVNLIRFSLTASSGGTLSICLLKDGDKVSIEVLSSSIEVKELEVDDISSKMDIEGAGLSTLDWEKLALPISKCLAAAQGCDIRSIEDPGDQIGLSLVITKGN